MTYKYLEKFKTEEKGVILVEMGLGGVHRTIPIQGNVYSFSIFELIELVCILREKRARKSFFESKEKRDERWDAEQALNILRGRLEDTLRLTLTA